jgi:hypothetical protein
MNRWFRLLLVGLVLAAGAAGCKRDASPGTVSAPTGRPEHTKEPVKLIPLPK